MKRAINGSLLLAEGDSESLHAREATHGREPQMVVVVAAASFRASTWMLSAYFDRLVGFELLHWIHSRKTSHKPTL